MCPGKHVSDFFLTAEQGVIDTIRTRKMTNCSSVTITMRKGFLFVNPLLMTMANCLG